MGACVLLEAPERESQLHQGLVRPSYLSSASATWQDLTSGYSKPLSQCPPGTPTKYHLHRQVLHFSVHRVSKMPFVTNKLLTFHFGMPLFLLWTPLTARICPLQVHGGQLASGQHQLQSSHG